MKVNNSNLKFARRYSSLPGFLSPFALYLFFLAILVTGAFLLCSTSLVIAEIIDTPYGPVEGVDFGKYGQEEFAKRSAEEYDGQEAGAGVVTDLVFTLTEENLRKRR